MKDTLAMIMAGGKGERLFPLTKDRTKPAVPFGGTYRLMDVVLSNCVNSEIYKMIVIPQYKAQSLVDHLETGWNIFSLDLGHYLKICSPQKRLGEDWYRGTADAIRQNLYLVEREAPSLVLILSGDHVYKMDYRRFAEFHRERDADVSVAAFEFDRSQASKFGILGVDEEGRITEFVEKPTDPPAIPGDPDHSLASMGIYAFKTEVLIEALKGTDHDDFGHNVLPRLIDSHRAYAFFYRRENRVGDFTYVQDENGVRTRLFHDQTRDSQYWRDVGDIDSYWNANMDLCGVDPFFNVYGERWPLRTLQHQLPPAKFVYSDEQHREGKALDSLVSHGCIISGATVSNSVLSPGVYVHSFAEVEESVIMTGVEIGRRCRIKKAIIDKQNSIPPGMEIGVDPRKDQEHFLVSDRGITVVEKGTFPPRG